MSFPADRGCGSCHAHKLIIRVEIIASGSHAGILKGMDISISKEVPGGFVGNGYS